MKRIGDSEGRYFRVLNFVREFKDLNDYSPSVREVGVGVGIPSTSNVSYILDELVKLEMLKRTGKARSVMLTENGYKVVGYTKRTCPYCKHEHYWKDE